MFMSLAEETWAETGRVMTIFLCLDSFIGTDFGLVIVVDIFFVKIFRSLLNLSFILVSCLEEKIKLVFTLLLRNSD